MGRSPGRRRGSRRACKARRQAGRGGGHHVGARAGDGGAASGDGPLRPWSGETDLTICPPFSFRVTDALVTNFHLPRSSLLLLTAAFAGLETMRAAYKLAVEREYRFYSYGDAMLIL